MSVQSRGPSPVVRGSVIAAAARASRRVLPAGISSAVLLAGLAGCGRGAAVTDRVRPAPLVVVAAVGQRDVAVEVRAPVDL
ncbi:MAG: hypothetical protein ABUS79_28095, partial [Pseudomonadota bacterium]